MRFLILLFCSFIYTQSSVLSFGGLGEEQNYQSAANAGVGNVELFSTEFESGASTALATIWQNQFTSLNLSNQFQNLNIGVENSIISNGIDLISVSFPITGNNAFQISLKPQYWSQYSINENNNPNTIEFDDMNISYKSHYYGRGGFSNLGLAWSQKLNDNFSFGLGLSNYFGNRFQSDSTFTYNISLNAEGQEVLSPNTLSITNSTTNYQGYGFRGDIITFIQNFEIGLSFEKVGPFNIKQKKYYSVGLSQSEELIKKLNQLNQQFILGLKYNYSPNFGFLSEFKTKTWGKLDDSALILKTQNYNEQRFSIGTYYHFINQSSAFFQSITLRAGFYYKKLENFDSNFKINDYGITLGTGFKYNQNANSLNLSMVLGKRKIDIYNIQNEKYIDLVLGIEVGEKWFFRKNK